MMIFTHITQSHINHVAGGYLPFIYFYTTNVQHLSTKWVDFVEETMKYQALRLQCFSVGRWWTWWWVGSGDGVVFGVIRLSFQSNSNSQKLSIWCKEIIVDLMKDLKYEHKSIFSLLGRVKLNFWDR